MQKGKKITQLEVPHLKSIGSVGSLEAGVGSCLCHCTGKKGENAQKSDLALDMQKMEMQKNA